jgi:colanic acid/amylovoran biosynthesis glycosyltransferase
VVTSTSTRPDNGLRPPKIGYVLKRFPRLSETFILNEILELERQGVSIEIFALSEPANEVRHEALKNVHARVSYLPQTSLLKQCQIREGRYSEESFRERSIEGILREVGAPHDSRLFLKAASLALLARARGVSHLHAHFATDATTVAMLAARLSGCSYSFTAHAKDIYHEYVHVELLKEKILGARFVVTVSDYNRRHLAEIGGEDASGKIMRLYNGIDLTHFHPDPTIPRKPDLVLAVGRLVEKKGFHHLVEACGLLRDRGRDFRCVILGEGDQRTSLAQQIGTLGLEDRVILAGAQPQEQLLDTLRRATLLVVPSVVSRTGDRDGLPTVLLEALAVGLPAISTRLAGIPEIIDHGETGLLVAAGDPPSLVRAIEDVLASPALRERLGRQGRLKAEMLFDISKNVPRLRDLFALPAPTSDFTREPALQR